MRFSTSVVAPHLCLHSATKEKRFGKLCVGIIIALRKFVRCVTTRKPCARNHTRLSAFDNWLRVSRQPPNSGIGYEDRAVCWSPRSEGCLSAFHRGRDRNHAD